MSEPALEPRLPAGLEALAAGDWESARTLLTEAATLDPASDRAEALDGLAEALWWLGQAAEAATAREQAFVVHRERGQWGGAARIAVWLAREYGGPLANASAARGWLARAESITAEAVDPCTAGWLALGRSFLADDRRAQGDHARTALINAREAGDRDLEILALARVGLAEIATGDVNEGITKLDEAMAAATAGEAARLSTVAEAYCHLVVAADMLGDTTAFGEWAQVLAQMSKQRGLPILMEFCECCQAEVSAGTGDVHGAEVHLRQALTALEAGGQRPRCLSPGEKLADLWISQGRLAEAEHVLSRINENEALLSRARLALARGDTRLARALADRFLRRRSDDVLASADGLGLLADAAFAAGDVESARDAAGRLATLAEQSRHPRVQGLTLLLRARFLSSAGQTADAIAVLEEALDVLARLPSSLETGRVHLELAQLYAEQDPALATSEGKAALRTFENLGAARDADRAGAVLRSLGDNTRIGAKSPGGLSTREREVLHLVAQGFSNAEIAQRLYISTKTAGNHVSSILVKLGVRNRGEAAAYALLHAGNGETE